MSRSHRAIRSNGGCREKHDRGEQSEEEREDSSSVAAGQTLPHHQRLPGATIQDGKSNDAVDHGDPSQAWRSQSLGGQTADKRTDKQYAAARDWFVGRRKGDRFRDVGSSALPTKDGTPQPISLCPARVMPSDDRGASVGRYAIETPPQNAKWEDMLAIWQEADDIDLFESAWNFDHFYPIHGDPNGPCLEAWVTLTALAQATSRLRIGCMVNGMHFRHPAITANMAASLDIVSGRPALPRSRRWLAGAGGRLLRAPPGDDERADGPIRRGRRGDRPAPHPGDHRLRR